MVRIVTCLAVVALAFPFETQAAKPSKPQPSQLTLTANPTTINFGGSAVLGGKLSGGKASKGQTVVVEAKSAPAFSGFATVATLTTTSSGSFSATVKPGVITRYRVTAKTSPSVTSSEVTVGVRIRVGIVLSDSTPLSGKKVVFSGRAYPAHDGQLVSIQRRTSTGSYTTIARTRLLDDGTSRSRYSRAVNIARSGVYRVRVASGDTDHLPGFSRTRTITVH